MTSRILSIYDLLSAYCSARTRSKKRRVVDLTADELNAAAVAAFDEAAAKNKSLPLALYPGTKSIAIKVTINESEVVEDFVWALSAEQLAALKPVDVLDFKFEIQNKFRVALNNAVAAITRKS